MLRCTCVQVPWIWFLWVCIVLPCMIPRKGSVEDLMLLNSGRSLPWANSYLLEILRPKNWNLTPSRNSGKFCSSLIETKSDFFFQQNVFPFYHGKNISHFSTEKVFPCTSYTPHFNMLILINSSFPNAFNCTSQHGILLLCPFTLAKV